VNTAGFVRNIRCSKHIWIDTDTRETEVLIDMMSNATTKTNQKTVIVIGTEVRFAMSYVTC